MPVPVPVPVPECVPVRRFRLLLALDFTGSVVEVLPQPFHLRFETGDKFREHVPDFLGA
ncbi:hypothetical protein [Nonomuraea lactucae]|uniref:hypothetical protein n=1 Tax=Nonomuraea lactucae TaxID=2249762 RepID=UPI001962AFC2|nr:hypothetical protein [Nonomuraea lactucae]